MKRIEVMGKGPFGGGDYIDIYPEYIHRNLQQLNFHNYLSVIDENWPSFTESYNIEDKIVSIEYKSNNVGYRSNNFINPKELLILGCSQTLGTGVHDEFSWPSLLSNKLNVDFDRLAVGGDSVQGQVIKAFEYFRTVGNPKLIVATFPIFRMEAPIFKEIFDFTKMSIDCNKDVLENKKVYSIQSFKSLNDFDKYLKTPFNPENIFTKEFCVQTSFTFISILEQYCMSNNISILWNLWDDYEKNLYNYIKSEPSLFHVLKNYHIHDLDIADPISHHGSFGFETDCHKEYANYPLFSKASDWKQNRSGHWSGHKHIHVAESFYKKIKENNLI